MASVFISYSWGTKAEDEWVQALASQLATAGVQCLLDRWHLLPGQRIGHFMEQAVYESSYVLPVCTPSYKHKSDLRTGGVAFEVDLITAAMIEGRLTDRVIPLLKEGSWHTAGPRWASHIKYIDMRGYPSNVAGYHALIGLLSTTDTAGLALPRHVFAAKTTQAPLHLSFSETTYGILALIHNHAEHVIEDVSMTLLLIEKQSQPGRASVVRGYSDYFIMAPCSMPAASSCEHLIALLAGDNDELMIESADPRKDPEFIFDEGIWNLTVGLRCGSECEETANVSLRWKPHKEPVIIYPTKR
jgi:hypothetical protein